MSNTIGTHIDNFIYERNKTVGQYVDDILYTPGPLSKVAAVAAGGAFGIYAARLLFKRS